MPNFQNSFKNLFKKLHDRKSALDVIVATLTIPLIITVIIANIINIVHNNNPNTIAPTPVTPTATTIPSQTNIQYIYPTGSYGTPMIITTTPQPSVTQVMSNSDSNPSPTPVCNDTPQPFTILFPKDGQTVSDVSPVCLVIQPVGSGYCTTQLSYSLNNSNFSPYQSSDKSICLNLPSNEQVKFQMKTKSDVSGLTQTYTLNFYYQENSASGSASFTPTPAP